MQGRGESARHSSYHTLAQGVKSMIILKTAKKHFEEKIPQSTAELFTQNSSVVNEPCDRYLSTRVIKLYDFKFEKNY